MENELYPVLCAWCIPKGKETVINYSTIKYSHGICEKCKAELQKEVEVKNGRDSN